ncbi:MAG: M61 family metallopeptidase [Gammaproteobacteria bacterium]|nr:MAG: M61 family metallopeptidase [Gammaproteobacteria bacterium]
MRAAWFNGVLVTALMLTSAVGQAADLRVRVDAREVARKRVHTDLTLAVHEGPLTLVFPKWIPGEHGPTGPLESIIGLTIRANGAPLPWRRDPRDMYAISVTVPRGAAHLDIALDTGLPTEGGHFSTGPTSSEALAILPWNEFVLLPKGRDAGGLSTEAAVLAPPGWQLVCALALRPQADGAVELEPASLARLIDSPLQMGRYAKRIELQGAAPFSELQHSLSLVADSAAALAVPGDFAAGYGRLVQQAGALFGTRMYRHYTWLLTLSDHVAHFGLEHHESSDDRVDENSLSEAPLREGVAELLAHEYVHSWNGKYRRPAGLLSPDYQQPMDGSLLWVYEGLTQFWGEALPVRAGLITPESYREMLAGLAGTFDIETGNRWRPMADTAVLAQVLFNAPDAWMLSRRSVDFYQASVFLWLNVDAELRARSAGRASLDDFVKRFYAGAGRAPALKPYLEADVYAALAAIAPGDWRALIRRHLDTTGTEALLAGLQSAGWQLTYSPEKNSYLETRQKRHRTIERLWSIGVTINDKDEDKGTIIDTVEDRAAAQAGAGPGMKLVAVNGHRYSVEVLDAAVAAAHETRKPIELLVQSGDYYRTLSVAYFDGARYPHLTRIEARPDTLSHVLTARVD